MSGDNEMFSIGNRARVIFWSSLKPSSDFPGQGQGADALLVPCGDQSPTKQVSDE